MEYINDLIDNLTELKDSIGIVTKNTRNHSKFIKNLINKIEDENEFSTNKIKEIIKFINNEISFDKLIGHSIEQVEFQGQLKKVGLSDVKNVNINDLNKKKIDLLINGFIKNQSNVGKAKTTDDLIKGLKDKELIEKIKNLNKVEDSWPLFLQYLKYITNKSRDFDRFNDFDFTRLLLEIVKSLSKLNDELIKKNSFLEQLKEEEKNYNVVYKSFLEAFIELLIYFKKKYEENKELMLTSIPSKFKEQYSESINGIINDLGLMINNQRSELKSLA